MICKTRPKKKFSQLRLFVLSKYFVFSVKRSVTGTYQVQRQAHLYALNFFGHTADDENVVRLKFRDPSVEGMNKEFELLMVEDDLDTSLELCHEVHAATMRISYNFPEGRMPHMSMHTAELLLDEINGYTDAKPWEDDPPVVCTNIAYFAKCKQIGVQPWPGVAQHFRDKLGHLTVESEPPKHPKKLLDLDACFKTKG